MKSKADSFRSLRRSAIGVGTFLFAWGFVGVVPVSLPFELPSLRAITLPSFDWLGAHSSAPAPSMPMSAIPEPTSWALMIGGMLLIGAALRSYPRRRFRPAF
jgi:hypothetical protein